MLRSRSEYGFAVQAAEFARYWRDQMLGEDRVTSRLRWAHRFGKWVQRAAENAKNVRAFREEEATVHQEERTVSSCGNGW